MRARSRSLVGAAALVAAAAAAVAFAWFGVERADRASEEKKAADEKLFAFEPAKVQAFTLEAAGETTRVARAGDGWRIEAPVQAAAERAAAQAVVDQVAGLRRRAAVAGEPDAAALARYGLAKPRVKVSLDVDGGRPETLEVGDENAFDGTLFVRTTGGAVELVGGELRWPLEKTTFDLREKRLLPFEDAELSRLEVTTPKGRYALAREGGRWKLAEPAPGEADEATVDRVLAAVRELRATSFLAQPTPQASAALEAAAYGVRLVPAMGDPRAVVLGVTAPPRPAARAGKPAPPLPRKPAPGEAPPADAAAGPVFARVEGRPEVAVLPAGAGKDLAQDLFALREKKVLHVDQDKVASLKFTKGDKSFEAKNDGASVKVGGLVWRLASLKALAFPDEAGKALAAHGLDRPAAEVALLGADGKELDRLRVSERGGRAYAQASSSPRIAEIDPAFVRELPRGEADLRDQAPASPAPASTRTP